MKTLEEKTEAMREVFRFLRDFDDAPGETDPDVLDYWRRCNERMREISQQYNNDPFVMKMLIAVWESFESKSHLRSVMNK